MSFYLCLSAFICGRYSFLKKQKWATDERGLTQRSKESLCVESWTDHMTYLRTISLILTLSLAASAAPAVVLLVRHAEKEAAPADDPALTVGGKRRAAELALVVQAWAAGGVPVHALFATELRRTQQTLQPVAAATGVAVSVVSAKDTAALVKRILAVEGGIVVVAGHSNTVPEIVRALGGPAGIVIEDSEFDRLFALTQPGGRARVVVLRYAN
jgi:phosphohistidine phosphatase SixA